MPKSDNQGFRLWPNPVNDNLFVSNSFEKEFSYRVVSFNGVVLQEGLGQGKETIDVSSLESGTYFVVFETDTGGFSRKVVVN